MMSLLRRLVYRHLQQMSGQAVALLLLLYVGCSWLLLHLNQEDALTGTIFPYWLMVTASTVGYGDISPETVNGQLVTALFIIPFGLGLFALVIGKIAAFGAYLWRRGIMGARKLDLSNHILVIGWDGKRTESLLRLLKLEAEQNLGRTICLYVAESMENPMPGEIEFIRGDSLNDQAAMQRACIEDASTIIVDTCGDDSTLTAALFASGMNNLAHMIAYFRDEALSSLLQQHCPQVECAPSVSTELLVKAAMDPGSTVLHQELVNAGSGMTQYSVTYPPVQPAIKVRNLYTSLKQQCGATLLAVANAPRERPVLNPDMDHPVMPGATLYYIAEMRIHHFDWTGLVVQH
ncbi:MAG: ion channel [Marinobacterium sp.]|nr:ion channel [Marinobacterium sp.]